MKESVRTIGKRSFLAVLCLLFCLSCGKAQTTDAAAIPSEQTAEAIPSEAAEAPASVKVSEPPEPETPRPTGIPTAEPTEAPTATPVPTVPPVSDEQLDEGYLDAWFDDSVMVGDSIAGGLNMYAASEREKGQPCLGNMRIIGSSGLTLRLALGAERKDTAGKVIFRSRYMTISEIVELTQAKRLFLMMGVRDLEYYSPEKLIDVYAEILSIIKEKSPSQTPTSLCTRTWRSRLGQGAMSDNTWQRGPEPSRFGVFVPSDMVAIIHHEVI